MPLSKDSRHLEPVILDFGRRLGHEVNQQAWSHWHFPSIVTNDLAACLAKPTASLIYWQFPIIVTNDLATCLAKPLPTDQEAILLTYGESLSEIGVTTRFISICMASFPLSHQEKNNRSEIRFAKTTKCAAQLRPTYQSANKSYSVSY